ncbi:M36 family metallopeptidase [Saprospiraceae bacterium]|nr:M36 family metallopeptidase [Saprospiraceae bacterium]
MIKNLLFTFLCLFMASSIFAQNQKEVNIAKAALVEQAESLGLNEADIENFEVSDHYVTKHNGASHLYLWQTHNGVRVYNGIITVGMKNDKIYNLVSNAAENIDANIISAIPSLSAEQALRAAGEKLGFPNSEAFSLVETKGANNFVYQSTSFAANEIPVFLCYDLLPNGSYTISWNVDLDVPGSDYWSVRIDANTGEVVTKNNYTVYCKQTNDASHTHSEVCSSNTHDNSVKNNTNAVLANNMMMGGTYRVYAAPAESPNHGDHELAVNPENVIASPYGWHDTDGADGAEYTITRGNNVHAYLDKDTDNASDGMEPDGGAELLFDFAHDQAGEPVDSDDAAQVNLFYMNNFLHDFLYLHGFNEASGNFQENNYGNGGLGGDYVFAEASDGSGTNNANFATPGDGAGGRMQMFLWQANPNDIFKVDEPSNLSGIYEVLLGGFGGAVTDEPVTGLFVEVDTGTPGEEATQGCTELINGDEIMGNIAVINRGACEFGLKALNAEQAGAIAVVICNIPGVNGGTGNEVTPMGGGAVGDQVTIPTMMMGVTNCNNLKASVNDGTPVTVTIQLPQIVGPEQLDASFDNGVIAHELGHGVSNRLTGGPSQAGCLGNDEQMGEGWSDYIALITSVEPGDMGTDGRGIGTYVQKQSTTGPGIRSQRYSTDLSINNKVYNDIIGTTAPHPLGEVWASITWDIYWFMVDKYGYDADIDNQDSGNARGIRLVLDGMREQGCSPGFVSGRDGILIADQLNNNGENLCELWEIFAARGVGFFADEVSTNDRNDNVQNFDSRPLCIEKLKIKKDANTIVQGGAEIEYTLTITNHIPNAVNNVVVSDEIPDGTQFVDGSSSQAATVVGGMVSWDLGTMEYEDEVVITYRALADATTSSEIVFIDDMESGDGNWDLEILEGDMAFFDLNTDAGGTNAWTVENLETETDNTVFLIDYRTVTGDKPALAFKHRYNTEFSADGGFVSVQEEGSEFWTRLSFDNSIANGFNSTLQYGTFALPDLASFSGNSDGFVSTFLDLSDYAGKNIRVQFRFGTDDNTAPVDPEFVGWAIDDVAFVDLKDITGTACVTSDDAETACATTLTVIDTDLFISNDETEADDYSMEIYPNPASSMVNIEFTSTQRENAQLSIYTVDGKLVSSQGVSLNQGKESLRLPVTGFAKGFYFVELRGEKNNSIKRLIIE